MCEQRRPSPLRAPRHRGGMMAEAAGKRAPQHPLRRVLTLKVGGAYITATTVRCRSARWRTCEAHHRTVVSRLAPAGRERLRVRLHRSQLHPERGFEALRFSGRRRWRSCRRRLLFEIVDRKKEKRGRRSPCGLFLRGRKPVLERSKRNFGGPTFRFIKLDRSRLAKAGQDRRAWDSSNVVIEPIRISNLRV